MTLTQPNATHSPSKPAVRTLDRPDVALNGGRSRAAVSSAHTITPLQRCRTINLPVVEDPRGNLTFVESDQHVPFPIMRVFYLYDIPGGASRGGHAHRNLQQFIIAMSGSFDITLDDGNERRIHHFNRSYNGLYVAPMVWGQIENFSSGSVCMVLASGHFDESDYYRDYDEFIEEAVPLLGV
jgi:hypothetical protein